MLVSVCKAINLYLAAEKFPLFQEKSSKWNASLRSRNVASVHRLSVFYHFILLDVITISQITRELDSSVSSRYLRRDIVNKFVCEHWRLEAQQHLIAFSVPQTLVSLRPTRELWSYICLIEGWRTRRCSSLHWSYVVSITQHFNL